MPTNDLGYFTDVEGKVVLLEARDDLKPEEVLAHVRTRIGMGTVKDIIIIVTDEENTLGIYSSTMTRADANWLMDLAKAYALGIEAG